jgi:hypothetical protein
MVRLAFGGSVIALVAVLLSSFYFFDRLIRHEYRFYRDIWEKDGRPVGFLFRPPEATYFGSGFALQRCSFVWLFRTPLWVGGDSAAKTFLSRFRWGVLVWNIGFVALFVLFLFHSYDRSP